VKGLTTATYCWLKVVVVSIYSIDRPDIAPSYIAVDAFRI